MAGNKNKKEGVKLKRKYYAVFVFILMGFLCFIM